MLEQEDAISAELGRVGYEPTKLPKYVSGLAGVKSAVWGELKSNNIFKSENKNIGVVGGVPKQGNERKNFDNAWARLKSKKLIVEAKS